MTFRTCLLTLMLTTSVACQVAPVGVRNDRPKASAEPRLKSEASLRRVAPDGVARELTGKVKLLSDHGVGVISNNGGAVISNNGGSLISDNGGSAIAENGAGIVTNHGAGFAGPRALAQAGAWEARLADADVEVLDGAGRVLADAAGKPIVARTDRTGAFSMLAVLPREALVLRVRVAKAGLLPGGELRALVTQDAPAAAAADVDTAGSLGASYVLERFVQGDPAVLAKLPASEAQGLRTALGGVLGRLGDRPGLEPADQVAATERIRREDPGVRSRLERIEAILLAGVARLGVGLPATSVALLTPNALALEADGSILIGERVAGRVRRVRPDGTMEMLVDALEGERRFNFGAIQSMQRGPDGALYVVEIEPARVRRLWPDGRIETVLGSGRLPTRGRPTALGGPVTALDLAPSGLSFGRDGQAYFGLNHPLASGETILALAPDGTASAISPPAELAGHAVASVAYAADGALWCLTGLSHGAHPSRLARRAPDGTWRVMAEGLGCTERASLLAAPGGAVYVTEDEGDRVVRFGPDGARTTIAGTGERGHAEDGALASDGPLGDPQGLLLAADGTLYLTEQVGGLVRSIGPDGRLRTVAGASGVVRVGEAQAVSMAAPGGLTLDPQGRLVIAETGASVIRRLEGDRLATIVGTLQGFAGDGGPATAARLSGPTDVAYAPDGALWLTDNDNNRIRRVGVDGAISTVVGFQTSLTGVPPTYEDQAPDRISLYGLVGLALGPDGAAYVSSNHHHAIMRIAPDGRTRLIAGPVVPPRGLLAFGNAYSGDAGDGGPARDALLHSPLGLAFRPGASPPELYVADAGNCRIRKIVDPGGPSPRIEAVAGLSTVASFVALEANDGGFLRDAPADEAVFLLPSGLAFDVAGDLYVAEAGTSVVAARGGGLDGLDLSALPRVGSRVRRIALSQPGRPVTTVAGPGGRVLAKGGADGLYFATALTFDRDGRLVVSDVGSNQLKLIPAEALR